MSTEPATRKLQFRKLGSIIVLGRLPRTRDSPYFRARAVSNSQAYSFIIGHNDKVHYGVATGTTVYNHSTWHYLGTYRLPCLPRLCSIVNSHRPIRAYEYGRTPYVGLEPLQRPHHAVEAAVGVVTP